MGAAAINLVFVVGLAVSCGSSSTTQPSLPELGGISDERGYVEHDWQVEAESAVLFRADLRIDSEIISDLERYVIEASIVSMDTRDLNFVEIAVTLSGGVMVEEVPEDCVADEGGFVCTFLSLYSPSVPHSSAPINFVVTVVDGAVDPRVTLTGTSEENPVSNDPNPDDNIVVHVLD